ncbi:unnamed protein product [Staurois parvus]|uniref:Uncharacterized protein n=1 Tax=Staurois parvus TaxID=386267 RepID=A0ABN9CGS4_9NEOB|nr:unnamed protein product [Staurois parvus]
MVFGKSKAKVSRKLYSLEQSCDFYQCPAALYGVMVTLYYLWGVMKIFFFFLH